MNDNDDILAARRRVDEAKRHLENMINLRDMMTYQQRRAQLEDDLAYIRGDRKGRYLEISYSDGAYRVSIPKFLGNGERALVKVIDA